MTEEDEPEEIYEIEIRMPRLLDGPIMLEDGTTLDIGDKVEHKTFGVGKVLRLSHSEKLGNLVYVEFESGKDEIFGIDFVKKLY